MALTYERRDDVRRIVVTVTGPYSAAEILSVVDRQAAEGLWDYGILCDERGMTTAPPAVDMAAIAEYVRELSVSRGPRGPVALVADVLATYAVLRVYSNLSRRDGRRVAVFYDVADADRWLSREMQSRSS